MKSLGGVFDLNKCLWGIWVGLYLVGTPKIELVSKKKNNPTRNSYFILYYDQSNITRGSET
ncbi:hypothetical protein YC2023_107165 [Brassica napus]